MGSPGFKEPGFENIFALFMIFMEHIWYEFKSSDMHNFNHTRFSEFVISMQDDFYVAFITIKKIYDLWYFKILTVYLIVCKVNRRGNNSIHLQRVGWNSGWSSCHQQKNFATITVKECQ